MNDGLLVSFVVILALSISFNVLAMLIIGNKITERCDRLGDSIVYMNDKIENILKGGENNERKKKV